MPLENGSLIFKGDGKPFATEKAASIQGTRMKNKDKTKTKVIAVEGGFALQKIAVKRVKRVPLGRRNVLAYPEIQGYETRVVNDDPDDMGQRIRDFENAGWEPVYEDEMRLNDRYAGAASPMGSTVNKPVGGKKTGVLMKKKKEWFDEDEKLKQDKISEDENGLVSAADVEGKYGKVQIGNKKAVYHK